MSNCRFCVVSASTSSSGGTDHHGSMGTLGAVFGPFISCSDEVLLPLGSSVTCCVGIWRVDGVDMFLIDERSGVCPARKNGVSDVLGSQLAVLTEAEESEPTEVVAR